MGLGFGAVVPERRLSQGSIRTKNNNGSEIKSGALHSFCGLSGEVSSVTNVPCRSSVVIEKGPPSEVRTANDKFRVPVKNDPTVAANQSTTASQADSEEAPLLANFLKSVMRRYNMNHRSDGSNKLFSKMPNLRTDIDNAVNAGDVDKLNALINGLLRLANSESSKIIEAFHYVLKGGSRDNQGRIWTFEKYQLSGERKNCHFGPRMDISTLFTLRDSAVKVRNEMPAVNNEAAAVDDSAAVPNLSTVSPGVSDTLIQLSYKALRDDLFDILNEYFNENDSHREKLIRDLQKSPTLREILAIEKNSNGSVRIDYKNRGVPVTSEVVNQILQAVKTETDHNSEKSPLIKKLQDLYLRYPGTAYAQEICEKNRKNRDQLIAEAIEYGAQPRRLNPLSPYIGGDKQLEKDTKKENFKRELLKSIISDKIPQPGSDETEEFASHLLDMHDSYERVQKDNKKLAVTSQKKMSPLACTWWETVMKQLFSGTQSVVINTESFLSNQSRVNETYTGHVRNAFEKLIDTNDVIKNMKYKGRVALSQAGSYFDENNTTEEINPFPPAIPPAFVESIENTCYQVNAQIITEIVEQYSKGITRVCCQAINEFDASKVLQDSANNPAFKDDKSRILALWVSTFTYALQELDDLQDRLLAEAREVLNQYPDQQKAEALEKIKKTQEINSNLAIKVLSETLRLNLNRAFSSDSFFNQEMTESSNTKGLDRFMQLLGVKSHRVTQGQRMIGALEQYKNIIDTSCRLITADFRVRQIPDDEIISRLDAFRPLIAAQSGVLFTAHKLLPPIKTAWQGFIDSFTAPVARLIAVISSASFAALLVGIPLAATTVLATFGAGLVIFAMIALPAVSIILIMKYLNARDNYRDLKVIHEQFKFLQEEILPDWQPESEGTMASYNDALYDKIRNAFKSPFLPATQAIEVIPQHASESISRMQ